MASPSSLDDSDEPDGVETDWRQSCLGNTDMASPRRGSQASCQGCIVEYDCAKSSQMSRAAS